jgi:two-component system cell cycle response regulator DivK
MRPYADFARRVLIVNGFADGRVMYATFLRYHGMTVCDVARPESALYVLDVFQPEIVVTDLVFPPVGRFDGLAFIRAVRQRRNACDPTIVVVSGFTQPTDARRARDAGADAFLIKPCLPEDLLFEMQRAFGVRHSIAATR